MSIQAMNQSIKFNRQQKRKRKTMYDRDRKISNGTYGQFEDHKKMKGHVFAEFQKEQFAKRKRDRKQRIMIRFMAVLITLGIVVTFLLFWNYTDFSFLGL